MSSEERKKPVLGPNNLDAEIIILALEEGEIDTTWRPIPDELRKQLEEWRARRRRPKLDDITPKTTPPQDKPKSEKDAS